MPWCPQCGAEYDLGCRACAGCQSPLVDKQPQPGHVTHSDTARGPGAQTVQPLPSSDVDQIPVENDSKIPARTPLTATTGAGHHTGRNLLIALLLIPILIYMCITVYNALIGVWKWLF